MKSEREQFNFREAQFVGVAGTLGAGKDTGAEHLVNEHGFLHASTGDMLRGVARKNGLDTDRNTLIQLGIDLRAEYGSQGALIIMANEQWQEEADQYPGGLVVTGMRAVGEAQEVVNLGGTLLFVSAPVETRYNRIIARQRDSETSQSLEQFIEHDIIEFDGDKYDATRPNLGAIKKLSHHVLVNGAGTPDIFIRKLDETLGLRHA